MRQRAILESCGYKHITTRVNTFSGDREHLFVHDRDEDIIVKEVRI